MEQYISKDALIAEIENRISDIEISQKAGLIKKRDADKKIFLFNSVLSLIDTLEVKEVDNEQLNRLLNWYKEVTTEHSAYKAKEVDLEKEIDRELETRWIGEYLYTQKFRESAKHFFELGLKASSHLTWEDISEIFRISEQLKTSWWFRDNDQTKLIGTKMFWEEVLKRFKAQKGDK